ncbi:MAG: alpha/beta hydrolase [Gammaproteobacteria bacterium]
MREQIQIDGIDVFIEGQGDETIVMIHGWPDTYRLWDAQVALLQTKYRCVRFTFPGFDIEKPRQLFTLPQVIQIFKHIIEQVSPNKKIILMVHDWACFFGYQFYMQNQTMVSKIIGVDGGDVYSTEHRSSLTARQKAVLYTYQLWLALAWCIGGRLGDKMTKLLIRLLSSSCKSDPQYISACMNYPYYLRWFTGSLNKAPPPIISCPMLFIYGTKKPFMFHSKPWADHLSKQKENQVIALDTTHWVMIDEPEKFNQAVNAWLNASSD